MQQLSAIDAGFLYSGTPRTPMHVGALQIYDPSTAPRGEIGVERIVENVRRRAHLIACFHRKLVEVPWRLDYPYWVDDPEFDPARHIYSVALPAPGDWRALCELVGSLHSQQLDRSRPLWEMHVIENLEHIDGMPRGAYGIFTKMHHAAVDGVAGIGATAALHDLAPEGADPAPPEPSSEASPSAGELVGRALAREATRPWRTWAAWPEFARLTTAPPALLEIPPPTRFDQPVSSRRAFDALRVPVADLRLIKTAVPGATINDVVLTMVGGALRRYLEGQRELPLTSLAAMVPVSTHKDLAALGEGNHITQMVLSLGTDIADPLARLHAVRRRTAAQKHVLDQLDPASVETLAELASAPQAALIAQNARALTAVGNMSFNTVVTNVKGPPVPFYSCGAKLVRAYGLGPVTDGLGLFHTALSYCGELTLSVTSCAEFLPDTAAYVACLRESYEALARSA